MPAPSAPTGPWLPFDRIGEGGLCEVWAARRVEGVRLPDEPEVVALKILHPHRDDWANRWRFLREGRLLQRLAHPSLPRCFAVREEPHPVLVLERLVGETLSARIRREGALPPEDVTRIGADLLRAVDHLHHHGVIHRDIKPGNLFLTRDDRVVLLDLGLAADPSDPLTTTLGDVMGTWAYMAPEQLAGAEVDRRSDIYSVGVTLYEALSARRPVHARGATAHARAVQAGEITPLRQLTPEAPARLVECVSRMMARDPLARPATAAIALAHLVSAVPTGQGLHRAPLVGRAAACGAIEAALDGGGGAQIVGESGSGSSRMMAWALERARAQGFETLALRCRPGMRPGAPAQALARDLAQLGGPPVGATPPSPAALGRALAALCGEGPVLVAIEGAEHCDLDTCATLNAALSAAPGVAVVVTGAEPLRGLPGHVVRLRPLSVAETDALLRGVLGTSAPPAGLAGSLHRVAAGQPAIIVSTVKELVSRGALTCEGVGEDGLPWWRLDPTADLAPLAGLVRLFGAELAALPDDARRLLDVLAVVGEAVSMAIALDLAQVDPSGAALHALAAREIAVLEHHPDGDWIVLRRPAVASLVLAQVPAARQTAIHAALAEALRRLPPDPWAEGRVAWHAAHGATPDDAPAALLQLGELLLRQGAPAQALEVLDRATHAPGAPAEIGARLALARGRALDALDRRAEAVVSLERARELAARGQERRLEGEALTALAQAWRGLGDARRARNHADEAVEATRADPAAPGRVEALLEAAEGLRLGARGDEAQAHLREALELSDRAGRADARARALGALGLLFAEEGRLTEAEQHTEALVDHLRGSSDTQRIVPALATLAVIRRRMGLLDLALEALDEADDVCRFSAQPFARARAQVVRATVMLSVDDREGAADLLRHARVALDPEASALLRAGWREAAAALRLRDGDSQAALAMYQAGEAEATRAGLVGFAAYCLGMTGVLTADSAAISEALDVLRAGGDRRFSAALLTRGATLGGDAEVLASAEREVRACGDRMLLLEVLRAGGGRLNRQEALAICRELLPRVPAALAPRFLDLDAVRWTGLPDLLDLRRARA